MTLFTISYIALWILVLLLCFVALDYLKRNRPRKRTLMLQEVGFPKGHTVPIQHFPDADGKPVALTNRAKAGTVLLFAAEGCSACKSLYPVLEPFQRRHPEVSVVMLYVHGNESLEELREQHGMSFPVCPADYDDFADFNVNTYPFAYFLSPDGKVLNKGGIARGAGDLELLIHP